MWWTLVRVRSGCISPVLVSFNNTRECISCAGDDESLDEYLRDAGGYEWSGHDGVGHGYQDNQLPQPSGTFKAWISALACDHVNPDHMSTDIWSCLSALYMTVCRCVWFCEDESGWLWLLDAGGHVYVWVITTMCEWSLMLEIESVWMWWLLFRMCWSLGYVCLDVIVTGTVWLCMSVVMLG